ncbi:MAG: ABC transporter substrate-binding protein [Deinococcota bacterium]
MKKVFAVLILLLISFVLAQTGTLTAANVGLAEPAANTVELVEITDECRVIAHPLGETCAPLNPTRIVSLDPGMVTDNLIALERTPIGSTVYSQEDDAAYPPAIIEQAGNIEVVGVGDPNLEAILALDPDLIIARGPFQFGDAYEQFSAIAPSITVEDSNDWRTKLEDIAIITGDEALAEDLMNQFYVDAAALDEQLPDMEIALLRPRPDLMQVYGIDAEATRILGAIGLSLTPVPGGATNLWGPTGEEAGQISYEVLDLIEGEVFFVISYNLDTEQMENFLTGQVWNALPVVQADNAFNVEGTAWTNHGYFGVYEVLAEVEAALLGGGM